MTILKALKKGWEGSGLTYKQFGAKFDLSESSMHKKLNGQQKMTIVEAEQFAKKLGVRISAELK